MQTEQHGPVALIDVVDAIAVDVEIAAFKRKKASVEPRRTVGKRFTSEEVDVRLRHAHIFEPGKV